jgi:hypothetical protein
MWIEQQLYRRRQGALPACRTLNRRRPARICGLGMFQALRLNSVQQRNRRLGAPRVGTFDRPILRLTSDARRLRFADGCDKRICLSARKTIFLEAEVKARKCRGTRIQRHTNRCALTSYFK